MIRAFAIAAALLFAASAHAQTKSYPAPLAGQAMMSVTASSTTIATANMTLTTNSSGFPPGNLPNAYLRLKVPSGQTGTVSVCWFGGTCTAATGEVIAVGEVVQKGITWNVVTNPPTVISSTGTVLVEVEW